MSKLFVELVDATLLQQLTDTLYAAFGLPSAIITTEGTVVTGSGWQEICTDFHRQNPESAKACIASDTAIHDMIKSGKKYCIYECPHGLIDSSSPVIIDGMHMANVFTGQFFASPPTPEIAAAFRKRAQRYGFDEEAYLGALRKVPVFPPDKHHQMLDVLVSIATLVSNQGLTRLRERESNLKTQASIKRLNEAQRIAQVGSWEWTQQDNVVQWSEEMYRLGGFEIGTTPDLAEWRQRIVADDRQTYDDALGSVAAGSPPDVLKYRYGRVDGDIRHFISRATMVTGDSEEQVKLVGTLHDVTDIEMAAIELREKEEVLSRIVENFPDAWISIIERELTIGFTSGQRLIGSDLVPEPALGMTPDQLFGSQAQFVTEQYERVFGGEEVLFELQTGAQCEQYKVVPIKSDDGSINRLLSVVENVTESRQASRELQNVKDELEKFFNLIPDMVCIASAEGRLDRLNQAWTHTLGYATADMLDKPFTDFIHPEDVERTFAEVQIQLEGGTTAEFVNRYRHQDGSYRWFEWKAAPAQDGKLFATARDITSRREFDRALQESEERLQKYISCAPNGIFVTNALGQYVEVNEAACAMTGYSAAELGQLFIYNLTPAASAAAILELFEELKSAGRVRSELELQRKDGSVFWASLEAVSLSEDRFMGFCADITETRRLQELESRAARLETAGTIAGQVAHDFNNLLAPLMAYPQFIREELPADHQALQFVELIEVAANKIAGINQDLLAMGRRGHYNLVPLRLNAIVINALSEIHSYPATLVCDLDLDPDLANILGGSAQLSRMIANLLHNARDAMHDQGRIVIKTDNMLVDGRSEVAGQVPDGQYVLLTISDTGSGISADIVERIYDPFFTSKTTDKKRGSGLGMSVVDAVVKDHSGFIDLKTRVGQGTSFYIYLPATEAPVEDMGRNDICTGSESILIVDDDNIQRVVSKQILARLGYDVHTVASGEAAVQHLQRNSRDLLVLDMVLANGIDGTETYRRILEDNPDQQAIILSGFSESERVVAAQELGAGVFVKKPVTSSILSAAVRTEIDRKRTLQ